MSSFDTIWKAVEDTDREYISVLGQVLNVYDFNKVAITSHSTRIEGSTLTITEAQNLIEKGIQATGKPIDHQNMVLDHYEALEFVLAKAKSKTPITIDFIRALASITMKRTGKVVNSVLGDRDESKGDFRKVNVSAGGHFFVDQSKVEEMMKKYVSNINHFLTTVRSSEEIYTLAYTAHFDLVSIHPFTDGNGRVSRLIMNYIEACHERPLTVVHAEDKATYIDKLKLCDQSKSVDPIVEFLAQQHTKYLDSLLKAYKEQINLEAKKASSKDRDNNFSLFF